MKKFFHRYTIFLISLGLATFIESIFSIEWSYPYCLHPDSGSAVSVLGMPFPYFRQSLVSSMEYTFVPFVLILNMVVLLVFFYASIGFLLNAACVSKSWNRKIRLGLLEVCMIGIACYCKIKMGFLTYPDWNGGTMAYWGSYADLRPVGISTEEPSFSCTPSRWWFPNEKAQK